MKPNVEKFEALVSNQESGWHKEAEERLRNKLWQNKAFDIALTLLKYKDAYKLNQAELARKIGVSKQYINRILQGKENLTLETIGKIEDALQISIITINKTDIHSFETVKLSPIFYTQPIRYNKSSFNLSEIESSYEHCFETKIAWL